MLYSHPLFLIGLIVRAVLILTVSSTAVTGWYAPFLDLSIVNISIDPWATWLAKGGAPAAFPYGYAMWLMFLPLSILAKLTGFPLFIAYGLTLLVADWGLLLLLRKLVPGRDRMLLAVYWLSPIVVIGSYILGLNDLVPVLLLVLSLYNMRQLKLLPAGAFLIAAISAKLSMALALPFFLVYMLHTRALHQLLPSFVKGAALALAVLGLPFILSGSGLQMLFGNPEMAKVYQFALPIGNAISIYVVPLVYLVMLYGAWRVRRLNFELFQSMLGMSFLLVVLLTPASPGWFIWAMPLLVIYQAMSGRIAIMLSGAFSILYVLTTLYTQFELPHAAIFELSGHLGPQAASLLHTVMVAIGIVLAIRIWRETISHNDYFRLSRRPFVIGIAGDSASGKNTLADALQGLFGSHSVAQLSGDDYHLWDRQKPMWQVMTDLNPMANDLERYANDLVSLVDGKPVLLRHYDHRTGISSEQVQIKSNDFIIASGLHVLYLPILRRCLNLSIYLDIDEALRRYLKQKRDVGVRGHSVEQVQSTFAKREPDSEQFIRPQSAHADLVLSLHPIHPRMLEGIDGKHPLRYKLHVCSRNGLNEMSLTRILVGVCGLHVDMVVSKDAAEVSLTIEGEASAEDIALAAKMLCPRVLDFLDIAPKWEGGVLGLMQLVSLSHINQALTRRFI